MPRKYWRWANRLADTPHAGYLFDEDQVVLRVVGTDPGTSSLDLLLLEDGQVVDQRRFRPEELREQSRDDRDAPRRLGSADARCRPIRLRSAAGAGETA